MKQIKWNKRNTKKGVKGFQKVPKEDERVSRISGRVSKRQKDIITSFCESKGIRQSDFLRLAVYEYLEKHNTMNIYQMYSANGFKFGFFVKRDSWGGTIAKINSIDGVTEGEEIKGRPPYYNNQVVNCDLYKINNDVPFIIGCELSCPGTYSYKLFNK